MDEIVTVTAATYAIGLTAVGVIETLPSLVTFAEPGVQILKDPNTWVVISDFSFNAFKGYNDGKSGRYAPPAATLTPAGMTAYNLGASVGGIRTGYDWYQRNFR